MVSSINDRYFVNTFKDDLPQIPFFEPSIGRLIGQTYDDTINSARQLLQLLEGKLNTRGEIDLSDYSVYTGTAGYSFMYYLLYKKFNDSTLLSKAKNYIELSLKHSNSRHPKISFLCGIVGPWTVSALINGQYGTTEWIEKIISLHPRVTDITAGDPDELLYGRCGYLYSLLLLRQEIPQVSLPLISDSLIRSILTSILESGKATASSLRSTNLRSGSSTSNSSPFPPLFYFWHDSPYVGAAHGFSGILYFLLKCRKWLTQDELTNLIKPTVDYLISIRFPSGNTPSSVGREHDKLVHWCHGAPGVIYTQIEAYKVFGEEKYLNSAIESSNVIWQRGILRKGYGLCHGTAGNGYAFLALYNLTKDIMQLNRAIKFASFCAGYGSHQLTRIPDSPWSLFEGLAGTIIYMFDLTEPLKGKFPAYQLEDIN